MERLTRGLLRSRIGGLLFSLVRFTPFHKRLLSSTAHPTRGLLVGGGSMREDWDQRAREHGRFYTAIDHWESDNEFDESGRLDLDAVILDGLDLDPQASVLEIGCGLGRLLRPLAHRVAAVRGVDISGEMVEQARERLAGCDNVELDITDGTLAFPDNTFDFCFAYRVFHHVPKKEFVHQYFDEVGRTLRPSGLFRFQVCVGDDTHRSTDAGTWFGVLFTETELRDTLPRYGFDLIDMNIEETPERSGLPECLLVTCRRRPKDGVAPTSAVRVLAGAAPSARLAP